MVTNGQLSLLVQINVINPDEFASERGTYKDFRDRGRQDKYDAIAVLGARHELYSEEQKNNA